MCFFRDRLEGCGTSGCVWVEGRSRRVEHTTQHGVLEARGRGTKICNGMLDLDDYTSTPPLLLPLFLLLGLLLLHSDHCAVTHGSIGRAGPLTSQVNQVSVMIVEARERKGGAL